MLVCYDGDATDGTILEALLMNAKSGLLLSVEAYAGDSLSCSPDMWVFCPVTRQSKLVLVWLMAATTTWICSSAVDILSAVSVDTAAPICTLGCGSGQNPRAAACSSSQIAPKGGPCMYRGLLVYALHQVDHGLVVRYQ